MFRVLFVSFCLALTVSAQNRASERKPVAPKPSTLMEPDKTALGALALLPKEAASRVARIEGPEGHPFPERWYVLVHDATAPRGLREFVIADGKCLANRGLSQFADALSPEDVIGAAAIKINNDKAAGIAANFAMHNNQQLGGIRYELTKSAESPAPVWRLDCTNPSGQLLGTVMLHATKGTLLSFQGFEKSPIVPEPEAATSADTAQSSSPKTAAEKPAKRSASRSASQSTASNKPPPRATPVNPPPAAAPARQGPVDRVGSVFRRIFRD